MPCRTCSCRQNWLSLSLVLDTVASMLLIFPYVRLDCVFSASKTFLDYVWSANIFMLSVWAILPPKFSFLLFWKFGERMYSVLNHLEPTWTSLNLSWNIACACEQVGNHFKFVGTDLWTIEPILLSQPCFDHFFGTCFRGHDEAGLLAFEALQGLPRPARGTRTKRGSRGLESTKNTIVGVP